MEIDITLQKRICNDFSFKKYFIENIESIVKQSSGYNAWIIGRLCKDRDVKKAIIDNLDIIFSKMENRGEFAIYMTPNEVSQHIDKFFQGESIKKDILTLFNVLIDDRVFNNAQIVELLANNIEKIYNGIGLCGIYDIMDKIPHFTMYQENNLSIGKIDKALANKIEEISKMSFGCRNFEFKFFNNMKSFKEEIGKKGPDFFINFPIDYYTSLEDCRKIAESIFGKFTPENFTKIKYGQNDARKALIIQTVIDELLEQTGEDSRMEDVKKIGEGYYSTTYKVGNYALKIGMGRNNYTIPNHRRILKPIVRTKIGTGFLQKNATNETAEFMEVQNLIETQWWENMTEEEIEQVLFDIYSELRNDGLIWVDVKKDNIGKLLKSNTSHVFYLDIDEKKKEIQPDGESIGVLGEEKGDTLKEGDYVIIDSDYILKYDDWLKIQKSEPGEVCREKKFEERYQAELSRKQNESMMER